MTSSNFEIERRYFGKIKKIKLPDVKGYNKKFEGAFIKLVGALIRWMPLSLDRL